jgi:hypothetical protein
MFLVTFTISQRPRWKYFMQYDTWALNHQQILANPKLINFLCQIYTRPISPHFFCICGQFPSYLYSSIFLFILHDLFHSLSTMVNYKVSSMFLFPTHFSKSLTEEWMREGITHLFPYSVQIQPNPSHPIPCHLILTLLHQNV